MTTIERDRILDAMSEQFMEPEITGKCHWYEIDGSQGVTAVLRSDVCMSVIAKADKAGDDQDSDMLAEALADYYSGEISSVSERVGFGARLSAPGYLDCTDWSVFDSEDEAKQYLVDTYGDDIELDEDEDAEDR